MATSYKHAAVMQAGLALVGSLLGVAAFAVSGGWLWLIGALVLVSAWPYTLIVIKPTNDALNAADATAAGAEARRLVETWGSLHAGRSGIGVAATLSIFGPQADASGAHGSWPIRATST